jgi:DNA-3-methyladenine glycosylase II
VKANPTCFDLDLGGPLDFSISLAPFGRWDDCIDRWDGHRLLRVAPLAGGGRCPYRAVPVGSLRQPRLRLMTETSASTAQRQELAGALRSCFVTVPDGLAELAQRDPAVAGLARRYRGLAVVLVPDPLTALLRSISAQQVNLGWAAEVRRRVAQRFGRRHEIAGETVYSIEAQPLASAAERDLRALQLTGAKSRSLIACARAAVEGRLERVVLERLDDEQLIEQLIVLPGVGRWTAEWFLARTLGRPRVVAGDLGMRKAVARLYGRAALPGEAEVRALTAHWGSAAALAQQLALHDLAVRPEAR